MDIQKLIEQLNNLEFVAYGYNINGEVLGMECTEFECLMVDASTALSTLQAENEKLLASLERVKRERDAATADLEEIMFKGGHNIDTCYFCTNSQCYGRGGMQCCEPKWRGQKGD